MEQYAIYYTRPEHGELFEQRFLCMADDEDHAIEQMLNAEPDAEITRVRIE